MPAYSKLRNPSDYLRHTTKVRYGTTNSQFPDTLPRRGPVRLANNCNKIAAGGIALATTLLLGAAALGAVPRRAEPQSRTGENATSHSNGTSSNNTNVGAPHSPHWNEAKVATVQHKTSGISPQQQVHNRPPIRRHGHSPFQRQVEKSDSYHPRPAQNNRNSASKQPEIRNNTAQAVHLHNKTQSDALKNKQLQFKGATHAKNQQEKESPLKDKKQLGPSKEKRNQQSRLPGIFEDSQKKSYRNLQGQSAESALEEISTFQEEGDDEELQVEEKATVSVNRDKINPAMQPVESRDGIFEASNIKGELIGEEATAVASQTDKANHDSIGGRVKRSPGRWDSPTRFLELAEGPESDFKDAIKRGDPKFDATFFDNLVSQEFWDAQKLTDNQKKKIEKLRNWFSDKEVLSNINTDGNNPLFSRPHAAFFNWFFMDVHRTAALKASHLIQIPDIIFSQLSQNSLERLLHQSHLGIAITKNQARYIVEHIFSDKLFTEKFLSSVNHRVFLDALSQRVSYFNSAVSGMDTIPSDIFDRLLSLSTAEIRNLGLRIKMWPQNIFEDSELAHHILPRLNDIQIHNLSDDSLRVIPPTLFQDGSLFSRLSARQQTQLQVPQYLATPTTQLYTAIERNSDFFKQMNPLISGEVCSILTNTQFSASQTVRQYMTSFRNGNDALRWLIKLPSTHLSIIDNDVFERIIGIIDRDVSNKNIKKYFSQGFILNLPEQYFNFLSYKIISNINWNAIFSEAQDDDIKLILNKTSDFRNNIFRYIAERRNVIINDKSLINYLKLSSRDNIKELIEYFTAISPIFEVNEHFVALFDDQFISHLHNLQLTDSEYRDLINGLITEKNIKALPTQTIRVSGIERFWFWEALAQFSLYHMSEIQTRSIQSAVINKIGDQEFLALKNAQPFISKFSQSQCVELQRDKAIFDKLGNNKQIVANILQQPPLPSVPEIKKSHNKHLSRGVLFVDKTYDKMNALLPDGSINPMNINEIAIDDIISTLVKHKNDDIHFYYMAGRDKFSLKSSVTKQLIKKTNEFKNAQNMSKKQQIFKSIKALWETSAGNSWELISELPKKDFEEIKVSGHGGDGEIGGFSEKEICRHLSDFFRFATVETYRFAVCKAPESLGNTFMGQIKSDGNPLPKRVVVSTAMTGSSMYPTNPIIGMAYQIGPFHQSKGHNVKLETTLDDQGVPQTRKVISKGNVIRIDRQSNVRNNVRNIASASTEVAISALLGDQDAKQILSQYDPTALEAATKAQIEGQMADVKNKFDRFLVLAEDIVREAKKQTPDKIVDLEKIKADSLEVLRVDPNTGQTETKPLPEAFRDTINEFAKLSQSPELEGLRKIGSSSLEVNSHGSFTLGGTARASAITGKVGSTLMGSGIALLALKKVLTNIPEIEKLSPDVRLNLYLRLTDGAMGVTQDFTLLLKNMLLKVGPNATKNLISHLRTAGHILGKVNLVLAVGSMFYDGTRFFDAKTTEGKIDPGLGVGSTAATLIVGKVAGGTVAFGVALGAAVLQHAVSLYDEATQESAATLDFFGEYATKLAEKRCTIDDDKFVCNRVAEIDLEKRQITSSSEKISSDRTRLFQNSKDLYEALGIARVNQIEETVIPQTIVLPAKTSETVFSIDPLIGSHILTGADVRVSLQGSNTYNKLVRAGVIRGPLSTSDTIKYTPANLQQRENADSVAIKMDATTRNYAILDSAGANQASYTFTTNARAGAAIIGNFQHGVKLTLRDSENLLEPSQFIIQVPEADLLDENCLKIETQEGKRYLVIQHSQDKISKIDISGIKESSIQVKGEVFTRELDLIAEKFRVTNVASFGNENGEALQKRLQDQDNKGLVAGNPSVQYSDTKPPSPPSLPPPRIEKQAPVIQARPGGNGKIITHVEITTYVGYQIIKTVKIETSDQASPAGPNGEISTLSVETGRRTTTKTKRTPKTDPLVQEFEAQSARYAEEVKEFYKNKVITTYYDSASKQCVGLNAPNPLTAGTKQIPGTQFFFEPKTSTLRHITNTQKDLLPPGYEPTSRNVPGIPLLISHPDGKILDFKTETNGFSFKHEIPNGGNGKTATFSYTWKGNQLSLTEVNGLTSTQLEQLMPLTAEEAHQKLSEYARQVTGILHPGTEQPISLLFRGHRISGTIKIQDVGGRIQTNVHTVAVTNFSDRLSKLFSPESTTSQRVQIHTPPWMKCQGINEEGEPEARFISLKTGKVISSNAGNLKPTDELRAELKSGEDTGMVFYSPRNKTVLFVKIAADGTPTFYPRQGKIAAVSFSEDGRWVYLTPEERKEIRRWDPFKQTMGSPIPVPPIRIPTVSIKEQEIPTHALNYNFGFALLPGASWKSAQKYGEQITAIQKVPYGRHGGFLELVFKTFKATNGKVEAQIDEISGLTEQQLNQLRGLLDSTHNSSNAAVAKFLGQLVGIDQAQIKITKWPKITDRIGQKRLLVAKDKHLIEPLKGEMLNIEGGGQVASRGDYQWIESVGTDARSWHYAWSPTTKKLKRVRWDKTTGEQHFPLMRTRRHIADHFTHLLYSNQFVPVQEADGSWQYVTQAATQNAQEIYYVDPHDGHLKLQSQLKVSEETQDPIHFHPTMANRSPTIEVPDSSRVTTPRPPVHGRRHHHQRAHANLNN